MPRNPHRPHQRCHQNGHRLDGTWPATAAGTVLGAGNEDHTVRIWDTHTGECRTTLTGHTNSVTRMTIAPDSTWLATTATGTVLFWNPKSGQAITGMRLGGRIRMIGTTGDAIAVATDQGLYLFPWAA